MRRTVRRQNVGVALFPFLAVLICTMGSLIVLLVLLVQQARVDARSLAPGPVMDDRANLRPIGPPPAAEDPDKSQQQLEDAQWRRELLEQSRAEKTQELAESRAKLAHLEDHIQRLASSAKDLLERARQIDEGQHLREDERAAAQAELDRLNAEIARKQSELDLARRKLQSQERWYALIPYEGPNSTRRRPIYIECTAEGVILQPEGVALLPADFAGPLGPGNPLDAALRTIREHISRTGADKAGEPYPLLVVRPSGIHAYGAARAALKSWDDEFGYELVSDDKKLVFGSPDPALATSLARSVALARQRQAMMMSMMPRRFQDQDAPKSFASVNTSPSDEPQPAGPTGRYVGGASGEPGSLADGSLRTGPGGGNPGGGSAGSGTAGSGLASGSTSAGSSLGSPGGASGPYGAGSSALAGSAAGANATPGSGSPGAGSSSAGSPGTAGMSRSGGTPMGNSESDPLAAGAGLNNTTVQLGPVNQPGGNSAQASRGGKVASGAGRGSNWALPGAARHATAITRPIRVAVLLDRLVLVPERGDDRPPQQLRISSELTAQQVDAFVNAVQREMKSWGLAVENGYWKPVLQLEVAPDSEHHFADLQTALEGSGFDIQRKQP
jgi:hypothetical protein